MRIGRTRFQKESGHRRVNWGFGQRENFVRELLDCFRGLRADENAVAFRSGASLRLNKVSSFGFF